MSKKNPKTNTAKYMLGLLNILARISDHEKKNKKAHVSIYIQKCIL
jgi:hypothetical protein